MGWLENNLYKPENLSAEEKARRARDLQQRTEGIVFDLENEIGPGLEIAYRYAYKYGLPGRGIDAGIPLAILMAEMDSTRRYGSWRGLTDQFVGVTFGPAQISIDAFKNIFKGRIWDVGGAKIPTASLSVRQIDALCNDREVYLEFIVLYLIDVDKAVRAQSPNLSDVERRNLVIFRYNSSASGLLPLPLNRKNVETQARQSRSTARVYYTKAYWQISQGFYGPEIAKIKERINNEMALRTPLQPNSATNKVTYPTTPKSMPKPAQPALRKTPKPNRGAALKPFLPIAILGIAAMNIGWTGGTIGPLAVLIALGVIIGVVVGLKIFVSAIASRRALNVGAVVAARGEGTMRKTGSDPVLMGSDPVSLALGLQHEIRNPLVSVLTYLQLLPQRTSEELAEFRAQAEAYLKRAQRYASSLQPSNVAGAAVVEKIRDILISISIPAVAAEAKAAEEAEKQVNAVTDLIS